MSVKYDLLLPFVAGIRFHLRGQQGDDFSVRAAAKMFQHQPEIAARQGGMLDGLGHGQQGLSFSNVLCDQVERQAGRTLRTTQDGQ